MTALVPLVGLAEGVAVGAAFVALVTVLQVVPRLIQLCGGTAQVYEAALALGAVLGALNEAVPLTARAGWALVIPAGLLSGIFVGMISGAIAEVTAILPRAGRRLGISRWLVALIVALALGKAVGTTLWWAVPSLHGG